MGVFQVLDSIIDRNVPGWRFVPGKVSASFTCPGAWRLDVPDLQKFPPGPYKGEKARRLTRMAAFMPLASVIYSIRRRLYKSFKVAMALGAGLARSYIL